jgi:hypothetical protein
MSQISQIPTDSTSFTVTTKVTKVSKFTRKRCVNLLCKGFAVNSKDEKRQTKYCKKCSLNPRDINKATACPICDCKLVNFYTALCLPTGRFIDFVCHECNEKIEENNINKYLKKQGIKAKDITINHFKKFFPEDDSGIIESEDDSDNDSDQEEDIQEVPLDYETRRQQHLQKVMSKELPFPVIYRSGTMDMPPEAKRFCKLLIPGRVISGGRQLCHQRIIDKTNVALFALWCHDNKRPDLFANKLDLKLNDVYSYLYGC